MIYVVINLLLLSLSLPLLLLLLLLLLLSYCNPWLAYLMVPKSLLDWQNLSEDVGCSQKSDILELADASCSWHSDNFPVLS